MQYTIVSFYFIISDNVKLSEIILIFRERFRQFKLYRFYSSGFYTSIK
ncbi:hypothetical protein HMPREF3033_01164 [Veillonellaceae bacterium DNF00751]|nr:hypothetical protein HMPREF3033_01164 [Veillonellaceae bacterium DNF00751]